MLSQLNERMQKWGYSWEGLRDNRHGEWWVLAQMLLIAAHWLPPSPLPSDVGIHWPLALRLVGGLTFLIGLVLGALGALDLGSLLHLGLCSMHSHYGPYMTSTPAIVPFLPGLDWR